MFLEFPLRATVFGTTDYHLLTTTLAPDAQFKATPTELVQDLETLNELRTATRSNEVVPLVRYALQLAVLAKLVPRSPVAFTWSLLDKGSLTSFSTAFERANTLANTGAALANAANTSTLPPKECARFLQAAAGCFNEAVASVAKAVTAGTATTSDADDRVYFALESIALAAAQETFVVKAIADNMSNATVAKLAMAASELFGTAKSAVEAAAVFPASWPPILQTKQSFFHATAAFRMAKAAASTAEMGKYAKEIAYLRLAAAILSKTEADINVGSTSASLLATWISKAAVVSQVSDEIPAEVKQQVQSLHEEVKSILGPAEKDNDIVYMEIVPKPESLPAIPSARMVKPDVSLLPSFLPAPFTPLFSTVLPPSLRTLHTRYIQSLETLIQPLTFLAPQATAAARAQLSSLSLPQAVTTVNQTTTDFLQALRAGSKGFTPKSMDHQLATLHALRASCSQHLSVALQSLDAEEREDDEARAAFGGSAEGGRWTRQSSRALTRGLRDAGAEYWEKLEAAKGSDSAVEAKISANRARIAMLGGDDAVDVVVLGGASITPVVGGDVDGVDEINKLKSVLGLLNDVLMKRDKLATDLHEIRKGDDVAARLLEANEKRQDVDPDAFIQNELKKYDSLVQTCNASLKAQDDIMKLVKSRNDKFIAWKQSNPILIKRDQFASDYNAAVSMYREIMGNLSGGIQFYSDFDPLLVKFEQNCTDYCMTRGIEKKELLGEVQRQSLNQVPLWDGRVQFNFNPNPPSSMPPPFKRNQ